MFLFLADFSQLHFAQKHSQGRTPLCTQAFPEMPSVTLRHSKSNGRIRVRPTSSRPDRVEGKKSGHFIGLVYESTPQPVTVANEGKNAYIYIYLFYSILNYPRNSHQHPQPRDLPYCSALLEPGGAARCDCCY